MSNNRAACIQAVLDVVNLGMSVRKKIICGIVQTEKAVEVIERERSLEYSILYI